MSAAVADRMRAVIAQTLEAVDPAKITDETTFAEDLGADSFEVVQLFMAFEVEFDIEIADDAVETCHTFGQAVQAVAALVQEADL